MIKPLIKIPHPLPDNYHLNLERGDYIVKTKQTGELFIDFWENNKFGFYCWELDALTEIVYKLPSCEKLIEILERDKND